MASNLKISDCSGPTQTPYSDFFAYQRVGTILRAGYDVFTGIEYVRMRMLGPLESKMTCGKEFAIDQEVLMGKWGKGAKGPQGCQKVLHR